MTAAVPRPERISLQTVEVHQRDLAHFPRDQRHRRPARNYGLQIVPAAAHAAAVFFQQLAQRDRHHFFDVARPVHMAADRHDLGAGVVRPAEAREPLGPAPQDGAHHRNRLDVCSPSSGSHTAPRPAGNGGFSLGWPFLPSRRLQQRRLLAADIGARRRGGYRRRSPSHGRCSCRSAWPHRPA